MTGVSRTFRLDHIPFGTDDVDAAESRLRALGFVTVRSQCRWPMPEATHSARCLSVMFAESYLDVIGSEGAPEGLAPSGVVLGTDDFDGALRQLEGFRLSPYEIERTLEDGRTIRYRITPVRGPGKLPVSVLHDGAPRLMRTPETLRHPNGARALSRVTLRTADLSAARRDLERLTADVGLGLGAGAPIEFELAPTGLRYPW